MSRDWDFRRKLTDGIGGCDGVVSLRAALLLREPPLSWR